MHRPASSSAVRCASSRACNGNSPTWQSSSKARSFCSTARQPMPTAVCPPPTVGGGQTAVGIGCRAVEQKLRAFELDCHVGEFPLQALELAQRTAELLAGRCMLARLVEGVTPER